MFLGPSIKLDASTIETPSGARAGYHTLGLMRQMVDAAKIDPGIISAAHSIIYLTPERDALAEVRALFEYVRNSIRYVGDVSGVETLCNPLTTLHRKTGDCDDQTMLFCALCESVGYPTRFVMAQYESDDFEHVYCQVLAGGMWIDCDPIEREESFGWAPPNPRRIFIERV